MNCPLAKSNHATLEFKVGEETENKRTEDHHEMRLNYNKTDFNGLRRFFKEESWDAFHQTNSVQKKM